MSQVNITTNTSKVEVNTTNNQIVVTNPVNPNTVSITQPVTTVVEVITAGPQGPPGLIPSTGSFVTTSSFNAFTSNYNTGSFTGSFTGSLFGTATTASYVQNAQTASYILQAVSASYSLSSSLATTSSHALSVGTLNQDVLITKAGGATLTVQATSAGAATLALTSNSTGGGDSIISSTLSTGDLAIKVGGTEKMRITSTGNVGIGTTVPFTKLQVSGSVQVGAYTANLNSYSNGLSVTNPGATATSLFLYQAGVASGHVGLRASDTNLYIVNSYTNGSVTNPAAIALTSTGNVGIGTTTPTGKLSVLDTTLASGSANAGSLLDLQQTWNTTGTPTAIKLNVTNTASNNGNLIDLQINNSSIFFANANSVYSNNGFTSTIFRAATNQTMYFGTQGITSQTKYVDIAIGVMAQTGGTNSAVSISPIYNQVTSTAANTDLKVNRTETSVGSGTQLLMDLQVGGVSKFNVTTNGTATAYGGIYTSIISDAFSTNNSRINFGGSSKYIAFNTNNTEAVRVSSNQNLLLGITTDSGFKLDVSGSSRHNGDTTITGSLLVTGSTTVAGNIIPSANTTYDLGSVSNNFNSIRTNQVVFAGGQLQLNSSAISGVVVIKTNSVEAMRISAAQNILLGTTTDDNINTLQVSGSARITDGLTLSGSLLVTGSTTVAGNIMPSAHNLYSLGTNGTRFKDGYFNGTLVGVNFYASNLSFASTDLNIYNSTGNALGKWSGIGNLILQSGSVTVPTDDGINRLQVSGSARITNGLTVTGSLLVSSSAGMTVDGINIGRGGGYISTNTAIGGGTLQANTTGNNNVIIGQNSGFANTLGNNNTYFGNGSGQNNLLWSNNSYFGKAAGQTLTTGGNNAFFGSLSGTKIADKSTNVTILSNSVMLGFRASPLGDNQTNQIVIGYDSTGLGGNTTVLGNTSTTTTAIYGDLLLGTTSDSGTEKLQVVGNTKILGQTTLSGSQNTASGSILKVIGSGSQQPIFTVLGSQGELFSITDSLSGSLFSVNDISGLPILEVFSDNTTLIGNYQAPALVTTAKNVLASAGAFTVYSLPTASYDGAFFEYTARSGSNARAGQIMAIWSGSVVNYTETTSSAFGTTTGLTLGVFITGSNMALTGSATTSAWTIKTIIRSI